MPNPSLERKKLGGQVRFSLQSPYVVFMQLPHFRTALSLECVIKLKPFKKGKYMTKIKCPNCNNIVKLLNKDKSSKCKFCNFELRKTIEELAKQLVILFGNKFINNSK